MLRVPISSPSSHDELFIERYHRLLVWSRKLTDNNREIAEDLVQDAFVQFTFTRPDLSRIQNLDGYLYGLLRHLHLSQVRRATRNRLEPLSIFEYESAAIGLRSIDPRTQIQVQDELRCICRFACVRKESAKAASVLILRFFHGYYPSEIVQILRTSRAAIRERLRIARAEARLSLENPKAFGLVSDKLVETLPTSFARETTDFLIELRNIIFRSRQADCQSTDQLKGFYKVDSAQSTAEPMDASNLAHIVACPNCLDEINGLFGLPKLADRYPPDLLDKETRRKDGPSGGATGGGSIDGSIDACRRRARETFEHDPQELCVAVNGYLQGTQKISSEVSELTLSVKGEEKISFVEIFSEQDVRLLLMNVHETPPEGPSQQHLAVDLSDTRKLELTLRFRSPWPTLHISYQDPTFTRETERTTSGVSVSPDVEIDDGPQDLRALASLPKRLLKSFGLGMGLDWRFFFRPGSVTALFALLLIAVLLFLQFRRLPTTTPSAITLLNQSALAEEAIARGDSVIHRIVNLKQRSSAGVLMASSRIEVWHSDGKGITARRLFDEKGALIAGDWRRTDGVQTIYHHGSKPQLQLPPEKRAGFALDSDNVWELSVSAKDFVFLIGGAEHALLEERPSDYILKFSAEPNGNSRGVLNASLVLSRSDLHATEMTVVIQSKPQTSNLNPSFIQYHLSESTFERRSPNNVAPAVFEPEQILMDSGAAPVSSATPSRSTPAAASASLVATRELEVEILSLLNRVGADLGEQISLTRTPEGRLRVQAIIDTQQRKAELQVALSTVRNNPAVTLDIQTRAEAASSQKEFGAQLQTATVEQAVPTGSSIPVDAELRRYFSTSGVSTDQIEINITRFSNRVLNRSLQMMQHAWALKRLADRFSAEELQMLDATARAKWLSMICGHAQALQQQTAQLQRELGLVFPAMTFHGTRAEEISDDRALVQAIARLFSLCSDNDRAISNSFTISADNSGRASIRDQDSWRSLKSTENLASVVARIQ